MSKIKIFESQRKSIDLPKLIDTRMLICANSGAGKSYAVRKILEETSTQVMSIVLDVEGEFKTLREKFEFLLIGSEGDVELSMKSVHLLPKKLIELSVPTIIDISDLKRNERIQYIKKFLESLMELPKKYWKPCLIVLDESHTLAGQQEKQDSTYAVIDLMTRGRKRGFTGILLTQRISKLHKDAVAETNNYMVGRTSLDIDMKRASDILGFNDKKSMLSLRDLEDGEFFVFGPAISKIIEKEQVALSKTTHPKQGRDLNIEIKSPTTRVKNIISKLNDLPQEAQVELKNLQDHKTEIARLRRELTMSKKSVLPQQVKVDHRAIEKARLDGFKQAENQFYLERGRYKKDLKEFQSFLQQITLKSSRLLQMEVPETKIKPMVIPKIEPIKQKPVTNQLPISYESDTNQSQIGLCARKIYSFLYHNPDQTYTKSQVGAVTGYSNKSGGFNNALSQLKTLKLIIRTGGLLKVGEINPEIAGDFDFSKEAIIIRLSKCEREIYNVLLENPYEEYSKEELANETITNYSHNSGGFNNSLSRLNTLGLIKRDGGIIKLNPEIMEVQ